jgi:hypothetical protein
MHEEQRRVRAYVHKSEAKSPSYRAPAILDYETKSRDEIPPLSFSRIDLRLLSMSIGWSKEPSTSA